MIICCCCGLFVTGAMVCSHQQAHLPAQARRTTQWHNNQSSGLSKVSIWQGIRLLSLHTTLANVDVVRAWFCRTTRDPVLGWLQWCEPLSVCHPFVSRFIVSHSDNTVRLINMATMAVELSIHGLRPAPPAAALAAAGYGASCSSSSSSPAGVVVQPGGGVLVLPVDPSSLQFFDVNRDRHIARLQVSSWAHCSAPRACSWEY